jgi:hypothetical protein
VRLKDALYHVDRSGFNAVDHHIIQFRPIDNGYPEGSDLEQYFHFFNSEFDFRYFQSLGHHGQLKAWRDAGPRVVLAGGGHEALFAGRRIYPYNFLIKHYPIRSQHHGEKKAFVDRRPRWNKEELLAGWHGQYDFAPDHSFLFDPSKLLRFDESGFDQAYLVERLANIGPDAREDWSARDRRRRR